MKHPGRAEFRTHQRNRQAAWLRHVSGGDVTGGETIFQVWYRYDIDGPWETPSGFPWMGHHVLMRLMVYNKDGKIPFSDAWIVDPNEELV